MAKVNSPAAACKDYEEDLVLYYYGECPPAERGRIQAHADRCASCSRFLADLKALLPLTVKADDPPQPFWENYSRELRQKLAGAGEKAPWWDWLFAPLRPWRVPTLATAMLFILALTLTFTKGLWRTQDLPPNEAAVLEVMPIAENLEFFKSLDLLDSLDLLEEMGSPRDDGVA